MAINLSIKGVPEALADRLRARAERHHRSLQGELMAIIESAAAAEEALPAHPNGRVQGSKTIEQLVAERRLRDPHPVSAGPLAVDIIRADRDSR